MTVEIRSAAPGDGAACAAAMLDAARYYAAMDPRRFTVPDSEGFADFCEEFWAGPPDPDQVRMVAEVDGEVVGCLSAHVLRPGPNAHRNFVRRLHLTRLSVDVLMVAERARRGGVATALMDAAHEWGAARGAVLSTLETHVHSPLSVPFYERRMGYASSEMVFERPLGSG